MKGYEIIGNWYVSKEFSQEDRTRLRKQMDFLKSGSVPADRVEKHRYYLYFDKFRKMTNLEYLVSAELFERIEALDEEVDDDTKYEIVERIVRTEMSKCSGAQIPYAEHLLNGSTIDIPHDPFIIPGSYFEEKRRDGYISAMQALRKKVQDYKEHAEQDRLTESQIVLLSDLERRNMIRKPNFLILLTDKENPLYATVTVNFRTRQAYLDPVKKD